VSLRGDRDAPGDHLTRIARTILIGYDGSAEADDALALGRLLAPPLGGELVAVCVGKQQADAEDALAGAKGDDLRRVPVASRSPAQGLFELATADGADLLVIGSSHHSGLGAVLAGSVGRGLLHGPPCPVALAPRGYREQEVDRLRVLGVGYDATPGAERALDGAIELAQGAEATMRLIAALTPIDPRWENGSRHGTLQEAVSDAVDRCPRELRADPRPRKGAAAAVLRDEADMGIDLLVLGSHGYGPVLRRLVGSVSADLLQSPPCPVLVIPNTLATLAPPRVVDVQRPRRGGG
jgi:nucleotide-binding universal stress UspA family protein